MTIVYGLLPCGRVDEVDGDPVVTTFAVLFLPLVPLGSECAGFGVGWHAKSVVAAYVRWWSPLAALALHAGGCSFAALLALAAWASSFVWGRASARTRARREALSRATRVSALPQHVDPLARRSILRGLARDLRRGGTLEQELALGLHVACAAPGSTAAHTLVREAEAALAGRPFDGATLRAASARAQAEAEELAAGPLGSGCRAAGTSVALDRSLAVDLFRSL